MSTPRRRPWTCGFWPTPPKTVWVVRPAALASGWSASLDLADQLAGRGEDQRARAARGRRAAGQLEPGDQREQERVGLAGAGAAPAEHVAAGERVGQGRCLDGSRVGDAEAGEDLGQGCGHAEFGEVLGRQGKSTLFCGTDPPQPGRSPGTCGAVAATHGQHAARRTSCGSSLRGEPVDPLHHRGACIRVTRRRAPRRRSGACGWCARRRGSSGAAATGRGRPASAAGAPSAARSRT